MLYLHASYIRFHEVVLRPRVPLYTCTLAYTSYSYVFPFVIGPNVTVFIDFLRITGSHIIPAGRYV
jgi:hypothetical protein